MIESYHTVFVTQLLIVISLDGLVGRGRVENPQQKNKKSQFHCATFNKLLIFAAKNS
jgi:hypothetical protein